MITYIRDFGPKGGTAEADKVPIMKYSVLSNGALTLNISNAPNGKGSFSAWMKATHSTKVWIDFCGEYGTFDVTGEWIRIEMRGMIDNTKPIRISTTELNIDLFIHRAQLEETHIVSDWTSAPGEFGNGTVVIDENGVDISGGKVNIHAGSAFNVESGGTVCIQTGESQGSFINLDSEVMTIPQPGAIYAQNGSVSGNMMIGGNSAVTTKELPINVKYGPIIPDPPPTHTLWFKPLADLNIEYEYALPTSRYNWMGFGFADGESAVATKRFYVTAKSSDVYTALAKYSYDISYQLRNNGAVDFTGCHTGVTITKVINGTTYSFSGEVESAFGINAKQNRDISLTITQPSIGIGLASTDDDITIDIWFYCDQSTNPGHLSRTGGAYINSFSTIRVKIYDSAQTATSAQCEVIYFK